MKPASSKNQHLLDDEDVQKFIVDGFLLLDTTVDASVHAAIDQRLREVAEVESWPGNNVLPRIPALYDVLQCPRVVGAITSLLGDDYLLHPHRAIHRSSPSPVTDTEPDKTAQGPTMGEGSTATSFWHQDAQSPLARARHHLPRFLIGFYFPHDTPRKMGPTRVLAGSHLLPQPPDLPVDVVLPELIPAGTFMLAHFDMVHAGYPNYSDLPRYMLKFVFSRVSKPQAPTWHSEHAGWRTPQHKTTLALESAWKHLWHWMRGDAVATQNNTDPSGLDADDPAEVIRTIYAGLESEMLAQRLGRKAGSDKHLRRLVPPKDGKQAVRDDVRGFPRRWNERAVVMEVESYALAAQGTDAIPHLIRLADLDDSWISVNVAFALGEIGHGSDEVRGVLLGMLQSPYQQVVRQAVDALGFLQTGDDEVLASFRDLMQSQPEDWQIKQVERGWTAQDQVRLNVVFACLGLLQGGADKLALAEIFNLALEDQGYCAQVAVEGLRRLDTPDALQAALDYTMARSWDDTLLGMQKAY